MTTLSTLFNGNATARSQHPHDACEHALSGPGQTMKAMVHTHPGGPFQIVDLPRPTLRDTDVLVQVRAVSVNPADTKRHAREFQTADGQPLVLGFDAAGVVVEVGPKVLGFQKGDEVYYAGDRNRQGANAEYQAVDYRIIGKKPESLRFVEAAALPLTGLTAYEALFEQLGIHPDFSQGPRKTLLIIGGAGGVGSLAIQFAKRAGLQVVATAGRPESAAWAKKMGADIVIERNVPLTEALRAHGIEAVDYALNTADTAGYWQQIIDVMKPRGAICSIVETTEKIDITALMRKSLRFSYELMFTRTMFQTDDMALQGVALTNLAAWIDQGRIVTTRQASKDQASEILNTENLEAAHRAIRAGEAIGKWVFEIDWQRATLPRVHRVAAFTVGQDARRADPVTEGNLAGVVLDADALTHDAKQQIAQDVGYSETAFVSKSQTADFRIEFFTPTRQVADCGHATVAVFSVLAERFPEIAQKGFSSKELVNGTLRNIRLKDGQVWMEMGMPTISQIENPTLRELESLLRTPIRQGIDARADNAFGLIELAGERALAAIQLSADAMAALAKISEHHGWVGIYVFIRGRDANVSARMFAPAFGIPEESATGAAAGLLSGWMFQAMGVTQVSIQQGDWMPQPRPSRLNTLIEGSRVWVGGTSRPQSP